jgi:hypothetical protein
VSSIYSVEIHEDSDSEIEILLAHEDLNCTKPDQPFDYVNNIPLCLKDNKEFTGIKFGQRLIVDGSNVLAHNYMLPQPISLAAHCEAFFYWIGKYYTYIPFLQARIKALTTRKDSLENEK